MVDNEIGKLAGYGALLKKWSIQIPRESSSYREFCEMMENSEEIFKGILLKKWGENNLSSFLCYLFNKIRTLYFNL